MLPRLKQLDFYGKDYDDNRLKWTFANLAMYHALCKSDDYGRETLGDYPPLSNGSCGFIWGYDNNYINHHFNGIYGHCENEEKTAWVSVENYRIIEKCQHFHSHKWDKTFLAMTDAVLFKKADESIEELLRFLDEGFILMEDGHLAPSFPVFEDTLFYGKLKELLTPLINEVYDCMVKICDTAAKTLMNFAPKALHDKCRQLALIHHQMDVMAFILETMVEKKQLLVPDEKVNLCIFAVKK